MKHTLQNLEKIVELHNDVSLSALKKDQPWLAGCLPPLKNGYASSTSRFPSKPKGPPSIRGVRKGIPFPLPLAGESCVSLNQNKDIAAVFSVIDGSLSNADASKEVALCVGINFGQGTTYLNGQRLVDPVGLRSMRKNLSSVLSSLTKPGPTPSFHLVAANFFPWISRIAWGSAAPAVIDEAVALGACGYKNPVTVISTLVKHIQPQYLVFHGVDNCVPILGQQLLRTTGHGCQTTCLFTGNLAYATTANYILMS